MPFQSVISTPVKYNLAGRNLSHSVCLYRNFFKSFLIKSHVLRSFFDTDKSFISRIASENNLFRLNSRLHYVVYYLWHIPFFQVGVGLHVGQVGSERGLGVEVGDLGLELRGENHLATFGRAEELLAFYLWIESAIIWVQKQLFFLKPLLFDRLKYFSQVLPNTYNRFGLL